MALKFNRDLETARRNLKKSESFYRSARSEYYPLVTGGLTGTHTVFNQLQEETTIEQLYSGGIDVTLTLPLDISGSIKRSVQQAYIDLVIRKSDYIQTSQGLIIDVYEKYYDVLRYLKIIEIDKVQVEFAREQLKIAKTRLNTGRVAEVDVLTAEVQLSDAMVTLKTDEGLYDIAVSNLRNTLLLEQDVGVIPTSEIVYSPERFDYDNAIASALLHRLEIKTARLNLEFAKLSYEATNDPYRPTLNVSSGWGYNMSGKSPSRAIDDRPKNPSWNVSTSINIPLFIFDGGTIRESKRRAILDIRQAEADIKQTQESIALEVKNELTAYTNAEDRVRITRNSIRLARESLRVSEMMYRSGLNTYLELVDARTNLRNAEIILLESIIQHSLAKVRLYRAAGRQLIDIVLARPGTDAMKSK